MPNDPGSSSWLASQYGKFLEGLEQVGTGESKRLARVSPAVQVQPDKQPRISIPAWDDVIKVSPRTPVTDADYQTYKHFKRANLPSPLAPEVTQAIEDRRAVAERIRNSAIPEYQRGTAVMMTAVDNVQDAALTLSVGGKITQTALGRFGGYIAPAVAGLGRLAMMLGWVGIALAIFGIAYSLACQGPRDALAQYRANALAGLFFKGLRSGLPRLRGIPTPYPAAGSKGRHGVAMFGVPSGRVEANRRASRWAKAMPSFGELLQAGQVAYDWTGYGIALGGIMGASAETAYATARAAHGEKVSVRSPAANYVFNAVIRSTLAQYGKAALWHRWQCARALASAPFILRDAELVGEVTYGLTWLTVYASLEPLMTDTHGLEWREPVIANLASAAWTPWDVADELTRGTLEELGIPLEPLVWPVKGNPLELDASRWLAELGPAVGAELRRWLEEKPFDPWRRLVAETAMGVTERVWYWLEGANDFPAWRLAPVTAVFESMFLGDRWPVISDPPDKIMAAWAASEEYARLEEQHLIPVDELDRIWDSFGVPLLRLHGGAASVPLENMAPWDPETGAPGGTAFGHSVAEARARLQELLEQERQGGSQ